MSRVEAWLALKFFGSSHSSSNSSQLESKARHQLDQFRVKIESNRVKLTRFLTRVIKNRVKLESKLEFFDSSQKILTQIDLDSDHEHITNTFKLLNHIIFLLNTQKKNTPKKKVLDFLPLTRVKNLTRLESNDSSFLSSQNLTRLDTDSSSQASQGNLARVDSSQKLDSTRGRVSSQLDDSTQL